MSDNDYGYTDPFSREGQLERARDKNRLATQGGQGNGGGCAILVFAIGAATALLGYGGYYLLS